MASTLIHMAIGKKLAKKLNKDNQEFLLGTIAPDLSKIIGESRSISHFIDDADEETPNINRFLQKYIKDLNNDFVLGYYVHLYTDYLWFKYFIPEIFNKGHKLITKIDGTVINMDKKDFTKYVYNDYTNLNYLLIDKYNIDVNIFYESIDNIPDIIEELKASQLDKLLQKSIEIIDNSKTEKEFLFNMEHIDNFIELCEKLILSELKDIYL